MWFAFGMATFLLVLGLLVHAFKLHFLISGYNTMSKARREKVDVRKVARLIGLWSYANAGVFGARGDPALRWRWRCPSRCCWCSSVSPRSSSCSARSGTDGNIFDENGAPGRAPGSSPSRAA